MGVQQTNVKERLSEERAKARRKQQETSGGILGRIPQRLARNIALAVSLAASGPTEESSTPFSARERISEQSDAQRVEQLNADRAQAASQKSSLGFDLNVERLSEAGNLNQQRMDEASARVADLTQRMREATTLAEIQSLRLDYLALNRELTEEGLENQVDKLKDEARTWMWRLAADSGPAIDACTFGTDFGVFTVASDTVVTFQFVYGSALGGREEPSYLHNMFVPSPTRVKPADNDPDARSIKKVVMKWWDIMVFVLNYIGWTPLIITLGIVAVIIIYVGLMCLNPANAVAALQDQICQVVASGATETGGVGAITGAAAGN